MKDKIWITTEISTQYDQDIRIQPSEDFAGVCMSFKESGDSVYHTGNLYLDGPTLEALIAKLRETLEYVHGI